MFKTEQLPTSVTDLNSTLANVNGNDLSHVELFLRESCKKVFLVFYYNKM